MKRKDIADAIKVPPSTITRELKRNTGARGQPEQISGYFATKEIHKSHESIYRFIRKGYRKNADKLAQTVIHLLSPFKDSQSFQIQLNNLLIGDNYVNYLVK